MAQQVIGIANEPEACAWKHQAEEIIEHDRGLDRQRILFEGPVLQVRMLQSGVDLLALEEEQHDAADRAGDEAQHEEAEGHGHDR
ncbi:hypothetical protein D3C72_2242980 [compost metagenome]